MHAHLHIHLDHNHDGLLTRMGRDLGLAFNWLGGPAMSDQDRLNRVQAEARNDRYSVGIF